MEIRTPYSAWSYTTQREPGGNGGTCGQAEAWARRHDLVRLMHYLGDAALNHAAAKLGPTLGSPDKATTRLLDVGSGFRATGRYLHQRFGGDVTGVELQQGIHHIAEEINRRSGVGGGQ